MQYVQKLYESATPNKILPTNIALKHLKYFLIVLS
jgi:hypothetical protein